MLDPIPHRSSSNNFDALRFWAALTVLWAHAFPLTVGSEKTEPLFVLSRGQMTLGGMAVGVFFAISGYLITRSFDQSPNALRYIKARVLRIMPGLLVVLLATALIVGPLATNLSVREYFASREVYSYVAIQASFLGFFDRLPGVFTENPVSSVNGPLWTLRFEVECYALILILGTLGILNRYVTLACYVVCLVVLALFEPARSSDGLTTPTYNHHLDLGSTFLAGALIYQWRLTLTKGFAAACVLVLIATALTSGLCMAARTALPYLVLFLAVGTRFRLPGLRRYGDLSYGIYIYAWPVKQLIVMHSSSPHWFTTAAIATPIVLVLAYLSWHGIEKVALALKDRPLRALLIAQSTR